MPLSSRTTWCPTTRHTKRANRYVLENDDHVDVLVARRQTTKDGDVVAFDDCWQRRRTIRYDATVEFAIPTIDDLIRTKKWSMRPKDVTDIQLLEAKRRDEETRP